MPSHSAYSESPLVEACRVGDLAELPAVLANQLATLPDDTLWYPLLAAVRNDRVDVARYLLAQGAEANYTMAMFAIKEDASDMMLQVLIDHGLDINDISNTGLPLLDQAFSRPRQLRYLLEHGADPNQIWERWQLRPLDYAASFHSVDALQTLLDYGARLDMASPLHAAAVANTEADRIPIMAYLIDQCKIDVNSISHFGPRMSKRRGDENGPALQAAVRSGCRDRVVYLLEKGADPQTKCVLGDNALECCRKSWFGEGRLSMLEEVLAEYRSSKHN